MQWSPLCDAELPFSDTSSDVPETEIDVSTDEEMKWQAAEVPRELDKDLAPMVRAIVGSPPSDEKECTVARLLPFSLRTDHPELNFPAQFKRRRIRGKGQAAPDIGTILARLQQDSTASLDPWKATWKSRRLAYHEFELDLSKAVGQSRAQCRQIASAHWAAATAQARDAWAFLRCVRERLYDMTQSKGATKVRTRVPLPAGRSLPAPVRESSGQAAEESDVVFAKGIGLMRTFNTDWHNEHPRLSEIMGRSDTLANKVAELRAVPFLQDKFRAFHQEVRAHAKRHSMPSWAAAMEISIHAEHEGRVHLHDYIGPSLDSVGYDERKRVVDWKESDKNWDGMVAWTTVTSARGNVSSKKMAAVANGMYYVTSEKLGSLFVQSSRAPFEDGRYMCSRCMLSKAVQTSHVRCVWHASVLIDQSRCRSRFFEVVSWCGRVFAAETRSQHAYQVAAGSKCTVCRGIR